MAKPTKAELDLRIEHVKAMLYQGLERYQIVQYVANKWDSSTRTADSYIAKARDAMAKEIDATRPQLLAEHIAARKDIRRRFRKAGDLHGELKAMIDEAKLLTLYEHVLRVETWQDTIIDGLRSGKIAPSDVLERFGESVAADFFRQAGVTLE